MRFRTVAGCVASGALVAAAVAGGASPAAADVTISAVGWWTSSVAPPAAPDGGIAVSNDPSGFSVAALRLDLGGGLSRGTLKLVEAANQVDKTASMQVCGAADSWAPASGGAAGQAPADTCSAGSVLLAQQPDGSWTADIHQLLAGKTGSASVIVKPTTNAAPFQVSFERPTVAGDTIDTSSSESTSPSSSSSSSPVTSSDSSSSPATAPSSSGSSSFDSGSSNFAAPSFVAPVPSTAPADSATAAAPTVATPAAGAATTPVAPTDDSASSGSKPFKANITGNAVAGGHHATRGTAVGVFALALLIGAGAAAASWAKEQGFFDVAGLRQRFSR